MAQNDDATQGKATPSSGAAATDYNQDLDNSKRAPGERSKIGRAVKVVKSFMFTHPDGRMQEFLAGEHNVPPEVADHWYFQAHTDQAPEYEPAVGTEEYAHRMQNSRRRAEMAEAEFLEQQRARMRDEQAAQANMQASREASTTNEPATAQTEEQRREAEAQRARGGRPTIDEGKRSQR